MPKTPLKITLITCLTLWGGHTQATPPVQPITQTRATISGWYDTAYIRLSRAADRHVRGFDIEFGLRASSGGYDISDTGFEGGGKRVTATINVPLYSRKERMRLNDSRYQFMQKGLALITEARQLAHLLIVQKDNLQLIKALLQIEGATAITEYTKAQADIIRNEQRAWEVKALFDELVRE